jgi:hypothetical protein
MGAKLLRRTETDVGDDFRLRCVTCNGNILIARMPNLRKKRKHGELRRGSAICCSRGAGAFGANWKGRGGPSARWVQVDR